MPTIRDSSSAPTIPRTPSLSPARPGSDGFRSCSAPASPGAGPRPTPCGPACRTCNSPGSTGAVPVRGARPKEPRRRGLHGRLERGDDHRPRRQRILRSRRLLRGEPVRGRFLPGLPGGRRGPRRRSRAGAGLAPPGGGGQRRPAAGDLRPRRGVLPHVGHRGGDAGGAARPLPHPQAADHPLLRRLSRLVGRRAAGDRQPRRGPRHPDTGRAVGANAACAGHPEGRGLRPREPAPGDVPECRGALRFGPRRQRPQRAFRPGRLHRVARPAAGGLHATRHRADPRRGLPGLSASRRGARRSISA